MSFQPTLSRGIDYLSALGAALRGLQGFATLAYELVQNADDAPGVKSMIFNVCDEALFVENDAHFTECDSVEDHECPWKIEKGHRCDFHRFRHVAGADKREQSNTTGAFGIGFTAVYQITDRPELISRGRHWIVREELPEDQRIQVCQGCQTCSSEGIPATRFIFPWARDNSDLRKLLEVTPVTQSAPDELFNELQRVLPGSMLFLKHIDQIQLLKEDQQIQVWERLFDGDKLLVSAGDSKNDRLWYLHRSNFTDSANLLREQHPDYIKFKRSVEITLAIPAEPLDHGLLFAYLPSQHDSGLPFHINADFFPTGDRKRIILETDYQSDWNRCALIAAAQAIADSLSHLKDWLGADRLWDMFLSIKKVSEEASKGQREGTFSKFWEFIEPKLGQEEVVYTTEGEWRKSSEVVILLLEEESPSVPLLVSLGLSIVHEDLRKYMTLLRSGSTGVPVLNVQRLCTVLENLGLNKRTEPENLPIGLREGDVLSILWKEIIILRDSQYGNKARDTDTALIKKTSIAPGRDGAFWPCLELFKADEKTIALFEKIIPDLPFLSNQFPDFNSLSDACPVFDVHEATHQLESIEPNKLKKIFHEGQLGLPGLFEWLKDRRAEIKRDDNLKERLANLRIYPSGGELKTLHETALPGDFEDPLSLAAILDIKAMGGHAEFLIEIGVGELNFYQYAAHYLPQALERNDISTQKRIQVVLMLANKLGEIKDHEEIKQSLSNVPIVQCKDGDFKKPGEVYFESDAIKRCLDDETPIASIPGEHDQSIRDLYSWLGVADEPRNEDLFTRIGILTRSQPLPHTRQVISNIFAHLGKRVSNRESSSAIEEIISELESLPWLPARGRTDRWFKPEEVFASFRDFLFESQALFLDFPALVQRNCTKLISVLGVNGEPPVDLVVRHLLHSAEKGSTVNNEVFKFLDQNSEDSSLDKLKGKPCILLPNGEYLKAYDVYWGEHPFGRYRKQLGQELRGYSSFFNRIGVKELPDHQDASLVLEEIIGRFGVANLKLDDEAYTVLMSCWQLFQSALIQESITATDLLSYEKVKCVPNNNYVLQPPEWMFFENKPGLVKKFGPFLENNVITRTSDAWLAMAAAGVRRLGEAIEVHVVECVDRTHHEAVNHRIRERKNEIGRVIESSAHDSSITLEAAITVIENISFESATQLEVQYVLKAFNETVESEPESTPALYLKDQDALIFIPRNGQPPWSAIARELAMAMLPDEEPGRIASGMKDALAAASQEEAGTILDELGFAALDTLVAFQPNGGSVIQGLGGSEGPPPETLVPEADPNGLAEGPSPSIEEAIGGLLGPDAATPTQPPSDGGTPEQEAGSEPGKENLGTGPPGTQGLKPARKRRKGRLRSYVLEGTGTGEDGGEPEDTEHRTEIEEKGVDYVVAFEKKEGRDPQIMPPRHPGYDIESKNKNGAIERYIEVKSLAGEWGLDGAGLTKTQFDKALELGEIYWLYVVELAGEDSAALYRIQDPARKVDQFLFDDGWRGATEKEHEEN